MANRRRRENTIGAIEDDGKTLQREEDLRDYFYSHFKELFAPIEGNRRLIGDWSDLFSDRPLLNHSHLTLPFSLEEIRNATFQLGGDKAPSPDGFNLRFFFQIFWDTIKADLFNIFRDLFEGENPRVAGVDEESTYLGQSREEGM
ncbi:hypothetical protein ACMD2_12222, partial [Ananas comosus]